MISGSHPEHTHTVELHIPPFRSVMTQVWDFCVQRLFRPTTKISPQRIIYDPIREDVRHTEDSKSR